jgi:hypothetical protein
MNGQSGRLEPLPGGQLESRALFRRADQMAGTLSQVAELARFVGCLQASRPTEYDRIPSPRLDRRNAYPLQLGVSWIRQPLHPS